MVSLTAATVFGLLTIKYGTDNRESYELSENSKLSSSVRSIPTTE